jgi:serine/threonine protein kinase/tetratricopeptide (TPR) repeat protein
MKVMKPERWRQVERLYYAALEREPDERAAFLDSACAGDESLRHEVSSLIAAGDRIGGFMEPPAPFAAEAPATAPQPSMIGQTLTHYRIVSLLGKGGMGEVYLGEDTTLGRKVALKLLPAAFTSDRERLRRFEQEARAVSSLNHPNIITIHEIGQVTTEAGGMRYLVTEYIEGETLRQWTEREPLILSRALDIAVQVASALAAAHAAGITHRDIKPENVMVRPDGLVKVLDFGLAKLTEERTGEWKSGRAGEMANLAPIPPLSTDPGMVMGTVGYMSPEQVRGEEADAPSDIFSFGCVLYEMVTGQRAFARQTAAETMAAILQDDAPEIAASNKDLPHELERVIRHCLEKSPAERFQSARDLGFALREMSSGSSRVKSVSAPAKAHAHQAVWLAAAVALVLLSLALYLFTGRGKTIDSLAILPFANASANPDAEYLSDGIAESIISSLSQLPRLRVMARSTVLRYKGREIDPRKVGRDLHVDAVLTGNLIQRGETLIIKMELVKVEDGSQLWGEQYQRKFSGVLAVQAEIAKQISEKLRLKLTGEEQQRLTKHYTENAEAYQLYLKGRYYWNRRTPESLNKSIEYFQQATDKDPNYALGYAGLADSYSMLGSPVGGISPREKFPKAKAAALKALELDDTLAEAYAALVLVRLRYDWDWLAAEREIKRAVELNPNYSMTHQLYADYLRVMGRPDEAIAEIKRAQELEPLSLNTNAVVGVHFYFARQYDQAIEQCQKTLELDSNFAPAHLFLGWAYVQKARYEEAIAAVKKATLLSPGDLRPLSALGYAYAMSGQTGEAMNILDQLKELSRRRYISPHDRAIIYAGLGEKEQAFAWLDNAYADRSWPLPLLKVDPRFDSLRSDPRFADLVRRIGLAP